MTETSYERDKRLAGLSEDEKHRIWDRCLKARGVYAVIEKLSSTGIGDDAKVKYIIFDANKEPDPPRKYVETWLGKQESKKKKYDWGIFVLIVLTLIATVLSLVK
ncbi:hypothetical protein [Prosthecomicrobium sp. N25]|uniref:hypothetical protein n=1 Tax=Prosthecomicrobium sp. N25 TaxID=3129254 RepID=UPI003078A553